MFDLRIPVYRDHFREPDNYHPWVNGLSYDGHKEWIKSLHKFQKEGGFRRKDFESVVQLHQLQQSFYQKDKPWMNGVSEEKFGYSGPSTCFKDYEHGTPFLYFLFWHPVLSDSFAYQNGPKGLDYFTKHINLHEDLISKIKRNKGKICLYNTWEAWSARSWKMIINTLCKRYKDLEEHHFIVMCANAKIKLDYQMPHFVLSDLMSLPPVNVDDVIKSIENLEERQHNFICLNRVAKPHRTLAFHKLYPDRDKGLLSYVFLVYGGGFGQNYESLADNNHKDYHEQWPKFVQSQLSDPRSSYSGQVNDYHYSFTKQHYDSFINDGLDKKIPCLIDDEFDARQNPNPDPSLKKFFESSLNIVTECFFTEKEDSIFITEKTYKPIVYLQPFVLLATRHSLKWLKQRGYQTFDKWIDESYDEEPEYITRLEKALESAKAFYDRPKNDIAKDMKEMLPILLHNRENYQIKLDASSTNIAIQFLEQTTYLQKDLTSNTFNPEHMIKKKIGWIGLGKCGLPIAERISQTCDVIAYDILPKKTPMYTSNVEDLLQTDITFILVETPHLNKTLDGSVPIDLQTVEDYDYTAVNNVLLTLSSHSYQGVVVISSTVSPGTTKQLAKKYKDLRIVYMPVMIHIGSVAEDFVTAPMYFIGSNNEEDRMQVEKCIKRFVSGNVRHGTYEEVEMYKMFGNIYASIKIGFANTISEMIEYGNFNASSWNVMDALLAEKQNFNTTNYFSPGSGNGGPCHPRDGVVLTWLTDKLKMESQLLTNITQVRQDQALALAKHLVSYNLPIVILGKSFKQGVDMTVGSYSVLVGEYCKELGTKVEYDCISSEDAVILLAHPNPKLLDIYKPTETSVIVDLWNMNIPKAKVWGNNL